MINKRPLGKTGIHVSPLGIGTVKFGRNQGMKYPSAYELPDDATILTLLSYAKAQGINLIDTAPAYGSSEQRLGQLLKGQRHEWVIVSKAGEEFNAGVSTFDFSQEHIRYSVERSLKRLNTDYLDVLLVHSDGNDLERIEQDQVFATLASLKTAGLIRAYGMSTKTVEGGLATVAQADVVMATYNPIYTIEQPVLDAAYQQGKGVLIKKAFASGHLQHIAGKSPIATALNFVLSHPGVSSVIAGTINPQHLAENIKALKT